MADGVAAVPVLNAAGQRIAVLSMAARGADARLHGDDAFQQLVFLSVVAARVLVDLFKWFDDGRVRIEEDRTG